MRVPCTLALIAVGCAGQSTAHQVGQPCSVVDSPRHSGCQTFSPDTSALLAEAQNQLDALEPERAKAILDRFGPGPHRRANRLKYNELRGITLARLGSEEGAVAAFAAALRIDRNFAIPYNLPDNVTFLFERARKETSGRAPDIQLSWAPGSQVDEPVSLSVRRLGGAAGQLVKTRVLVRREGTKETLVFESPLEGDGATQLVLSPLAAGERRDTVALVHAIAYDADGNESVYWGSAESPREIHLTWVEPTPTWQKKRFLIPAIIVGAAAVGIGSWLLFRGDPDERDARTRVTGLLSF